MPRWTLLPGDQSLARLIHQTTQTHLGGTQEFGISGLHEGCQQDIERSVQVRSGENPVRDGIEVGRSRSLRIF